MKNKYGAGSIINNMNNKRLSLGEQRQVNSTQREINNANDSVAQYYNTVLAKKYQRKKIARTFAYNSA